jgi:hypothetical protein
MTAAVQTDVPEGLADVPVEKILELRETFPGDLHRSRARHPSAGSSAPERPWGDGSVHSGLMTLSADRPHA